jgi:hypothetical protein
MASILIQLRRGTPAKSGEVGRGVELGFHSGYTCRDILSVAFVWQYANLKRRPKFFVEMEGFDATTRASAKSYD